MFYKVFFEISHLDQSEQESEIYNIPNHGANGKVDQQLTAPCDLSVQCPPKFRVFKTQSLGWGLWEAMEPLRGTAQWEVFRSLKGALEGDSGHPESSLFSFVSRPWGEQFALLSAPCHCHLTPLPEV